MATKLYIREIVNSLKNNPDVLRNIQILFGYHSNYIEGGSLSIDDTIKLYDSKKETGYFLDDIEMINHFKALKHVIDTYEHRIDQSYVKQLHYILKKNSDNTKLVGEYKKVKNYIGGTETTPPELVAKEMSKLIARFHNIRNIKLKHIVKFHYNFEKIHPFEDGNGRVGRLIAFKECLNNSIVPFFIDKYHQRSYYYGLKYFEETPDFLDSVAKSEQKRFIATYESSAFGGTDIKKIDTDGIDEAIKNLELVFFASAYKLLHKTEFK